MTSSSSTSYILLLLLFFLIAAENGGFAEGGKRRIQVPDELDDVVDDEEDEAWKEWGKKKSTPEFDPPPMDFSKMDPAQMQAEMMKRQFGPVFGFAKLRFGIARTPEMVNEIAFKWTKLSRTGAIEAKFMGVDLSTIMVTMEKGQDAIELKNFLLDQPEAYEIKIGDQLFRREGDPPFEEVLQKLHHDKNEADRKNNNPIEDGKQRQDEL